MPGGSGGSAFQDQPRFFPLTTVWLYVGDGVLNGVRCDYSKLKQDDEQDDEQGVLHGEHRGTSEVFALDPGTPNT
jgi:hypothetical protein